MNSNLYSYSITTDDSQVTWSNTYRIINDVFRIAESLEARNRTRSISRWTKIVAPAVWSPFSWDVGYGAAIAVQDPAGKGVRAGTLQITLGIVSSVVNKGLPNDTLINCTILKCYSILQKHFLRTRYNFTSKSLKRYQKQSRFFLVIFTLIKITLLGIG